jgi:hypothetical protein
MINSVHGYPPDDSAASTLHELGRLNVENTRLRQELFDAAEKYSDLNDCRKMTEIEFKHMMKKEAEKSEKELSIRVWNFSFVLGSLKIII